MATPDEGRMRGWTGRTRVLHLVGSPTDEFHADLSRLYAADALAAIDDPRRYETMIAHVSPGGRWSFPTGLGRDELAAAEEMDAATAAREIVQSDVDVMVPQMFCRAGMTTYRAFFDLLAVPYVGNTPDVMALAAHKARAKAVVSSAGVWAPSGRVVRSDEAVDADAIGALPVIVKPVDSDNSSGLALVRLASEWAPALAAAREHAADVLVERYVELGREVRCGVVERDGALVCLPLEEYAVDPVDRPVRVAADKLAGNGTDLRLVAKTAEHAWIVPVDDPITETVWAAARTAYRALGCRDYGLFDFRIDPAGKAWFLEAGPYCSYAEQSVVAVMARAAGIELSDLFADGVARALDRGRRTEDARVPS